MYDELHEKIHINGKKIKLQQEEIATNLEDAKPRYEHIERIQLQIQNILDEKLPIM